MENLLKHLSGSQVQLTHTVLKDRLSSLRTKLLSTSAKIPASTHLKKTMDKVSHLIDEMENKIVVCLSADATAPSQADYPDNVNDASPQEPLLVNEPATEHQWQAHTCFHRQEENHAVPGGNTSIAEGLTAPSKSLRQIALDLLTPYTFFTGPLLIGCLIWKAYATKHSQSVANTLDWIISIIFVSVCV